MTNERYSKVEMPDVRWSCLGLSRILGWKSFSHSFQINDFFPSHSCK